jgi:protocatechuate 3,4-dioxygenase beta subunit
MKLAVLFAALAVGGFGQSGGSIAGRVLNSVDRRPVAGAEVTIRGIEALAGDKPQIYIVETGPDGTFFAGGILPGIYEVRPSDPRAPRSVAAIFLSVFGEQAQPSGKKRDAPLLTIEPGKTATAIDLLLVPGGIIAGRVVDSDGDPIRGASIKAQQYRFIRGMKALQTVDETQSDDRGEYRLSYLQPGRYYLQAGHAQQDCEVIVLMGVAQRGCGENPVNMGPLYYPGTADIARARELTVKAGGEMDGIDMRLAPVPISSIHGQLTGWSGPQGDVNVVLDNRGFAESTFNSTEIRDGAYTIDGVPPGQHVLLAEMHQRESDQSYFASQTVDVVDHDVDQDLVFHKGFAITGSLAVEGRATAKTKEEANAGIFLHFEPVDEGVARNFEIHGSSFTGSLPAGRYRIDFAGLQPLYIKSVSVGLKAIPGGIVDSAALAGPLRIVAGADLASIEGIVVDESGKPVFNAEVTILRQGDESESWERRFQSVSTQSDGKFRFAEVFPGPYEVYAWVGAPPDGPQDPEFRKSYELRSVVLDAKPGATQTLQLRAIVIAP